MANELTSKKLGSKTNKHRIAVAFEDIEKSGLGVREPNFQFRFRADVIDFVKQNEEARSFITEQRVSLPIFFDAVSTTSSSSVNEKPPSTSNNNQINEFLISSTDPLPTYMNVVPPSQVFLFPGVSLIQRRLKRWSSSPFTRYKRGPIVILEDNLSSHFSWELVQLAKRIYSS